MKHRILSLCTMTILSMASAYAGMSLTVPDVQVPQGGSSNVVIYFDLGTLPYTAYQFDIAYPQGINSVSDNSGNPSFILSDVYADDHNVSSVYTAGGLDRFQCFSLNSTPFAAQRGVLLTLPIKAQRSLAEGTYQATISPIEFVQTDATPDRPAAVTFNITVTSFVTLDESATVAPAAATGVDVVVMRTIKADSWSTLCLPFSMTADQVKAAFGNDVQLADFDGYDVTTDAVGEVVGIQVKFNTINAITANRPCVIRVSSPVTSFSVSGVTIDPAEKPTVAAVTRNRRQWSEMIGTYTSGTTLEENTLFLSDNQFWYSAGHTQIKAFRAYFDFYDVLSAVEEGAASRMTMMIDGVTTGIGGGWTLRGAADHGNVYDLQGRRVDVPSRGLYVSDGRKLIVK